MENSLCGAVLRWTWPGRSGWGLQRSLAVLFVEISERTLEISAVEIPIQSEIYRLFCLKVVYLLLIKALRQVHWLPNILRPDAFWLRVTSCLSFVAVLFLFLFLLFFWINWSLCGLLLLYWQLILQLKIRFSSIFELWFQTNGLIKVKHSLWVTGRQYLHFFVWSRLRISWDPWPFSFMWHFSKNQLLIFLLLLLAQLLYVLPVEPFVSDLLKLARTKVRDDFWLSLEILNRRLTVLDCDHFLIDQGLHGCYRDEMLRFVHELLMKLIVGERAWWGRRFCLGFA